MTNYISAYVCFCVRKCVHRAGPIAKPSSSHAQARYRNGLRLLWLLGPELSRPSSCYEHPCSRIVATRVPVTRTTLWSELTTEQSQPRASTLSLLLLEWSTAPVSGRQWHGALFELWGCKAPGLQGQRASGVERRAVTMKARPDKEA